MWFRSLRGLGRRIPGVNAAARLLGSSRVVRVVHGPTGIRQVGHRDYVGGLWEDIGRLQFEFMVRQGLMPRHRLLDIACGCLRGGVHFIPYLDEGHYMGIDKERELIEAGIRDELSSELYDRKKPQFVVSPEFEFEKFSTRADFALAQSLFTHLPRSLVELCLRKLRAWIAPGGVCYATFFECAEPRANPVLPDDHGYFAYTREEMEQMGSETGWNPEYMGVWEHPRGQVMVRYRSY